MAVLLSDISFYELAMLLLKLLDGGDLVGRVRPVPLKELHPRWLHHEQDLLLDHSDPADSSAIPEILYYLAVQFNESSNLRTLPSAIMIE